MQGLADGGGDQPGPSATPCNPALNGLRGLAALLVYFAHAGILSLGGLGVDIFFFVLSGFLITRTLWVERQATGRIRFDLFLARRALRLVPALLTVVAVLSLYGYVVGLFPDHAIIWRSALSAVGYFSNWIAAAELWPMIYFNHTWSLAVEEQFYLVWPLLFAALWRGFPPGGVIAIVLVVAVASALARGLAVNYGFSYPQVYFPTFFPVDGLFLGAALAIVQGSWRRWLGPRVAMLAGIAGAALIGCTLAFPTDYLRWQMALVGLASAMIVASLECAPHSPVARLLSVRPLLWLGERSYGIYLIHYGVLHITVGKLAPVLPELERQMLSLLVLLPATLALAWAMYRWIELPALRLKNRFRATPGGVGQPGAANGVPERVSAAGAAD